MQQAIQFRTTIPPSGNSINRSPLRLGFLLIPLALVCLAVFPTAQAQLPSPAPDGGYPNGNTAEGLGALLHLTTGDGNTAVGQGALQFNTTGNHNTANGAFALYGNVVGRDNTATGFAALERGAGDNNTANGAAALQFNTSGINDTAVGAAALQSNQSGNYNTANGVYALQLNTTGNDNTANGAFALQSNEGGNHNTAVGRAALVSNETGNNNTANGGGALFSNTTGDGNIALGFNAGVNLTTGDNNIDIGNPGVAAESNTIRIGTQVAVTDRNGFLHPAHTATFIGGISGTAVSGLPVKINSSGQLGVPPSSKRFKDAIKPMNKASEAILALKPVTFRYKQEIDPDGTPQFGLVAEEVAKVNPDLVVRDADGKPYTVRYEAVNAMLLNEFLKEHRQVEEQQKEIDALSAQLKEQRVLIQKVSDKVELNKPAPQVVDSNQ